MLGGQNTDMQGREREDEIGELGPTQDMKWLLLLSVSLGHCLQKIRNPRVELLLVLQQVAPFHINHRAGGPTSINLRSPGQELSDSPE